MRVRQSQGDGSSGSLRTSKATRLQSALSKPLRWTTQSQQVCGFAASRLAENTGIAESVGTVGVTDTRLMMETTDGN